MEAEILLNVDVVQAAGDVLDLAWRQIGLELIAAQIVDPQTVIFRRANHIALARIGRVEPERRVIGIACATDGGRFELGSDDARL